MSTPSVLYLQQQTDDFFRFTTASVIFLMQFGFGLFEVGISRNSLTIKRTLIKNLLCTFVSMLSFWLFGYALAFGGTGVFGGGAQFWAWYNLDPSNYSHFWLQFAYAATSCSIALGSLAERCHMVGYVGFAFLWSGFVYPIVAHWVWHPSGWLLTGFQTWLALNQTYSPPVYFFDAAGSGVVHITGGTGALIGALILGARADRFDKYTGATVPYRPHSSTLVMIGGAIIAFGLVVFNSTGTEFMNYLANIQVQANGTNFITPTFYWPFYYVACAVSNTVIAGGIGALAVYFVSLISKKPIALHQVINGALAAMASISSSSLMVYPWAAAVFGFFAGLAYLFWSWLLKRIRIDDVADSWATFCGGGGIWGLIATAFLLNNRGIVWTANLQSAYFLAWQLVGLSAIWGWAAVCSIVIFGFFHISRLLRVSDDLEMDPEIQEYLPQQAKSYSQPEPTYNSTTSMYSGGMPPERMNTALPRVAIEAPSNLYGQINTAFR